MHICDMISWYDSSVIYKQYLITYTLHDLYDAIEVLG